MPQASVEWQPVWVHTLCVLDLSLCSLMHLCAVGVAMVSQLPWVRSEGGGWSRLCREGAAELPGELVLLVFGC